MAEHDDGGPAFPGEAGQEMMRNGEWRDPWYHGLTKREWYAGLALTAIDVPGSTAKQIADMAFELADAMIERGKV